MFGSADPPASSRAGPFVPRPVPGGTVLDLGGLGSLPRSRSGVRSRAGLGRGPLAVLDPQRDQRSRVGFPGGIRSKRKFRWSGVPSTSVRECTRTYRVRPWVPLVPFRLTLSKISRRSNSGRDPAEFCPFAGYQPYKFLDQMTQVLVPGSAGGSGSSTATFG